MGEYKEYETSAGHAYIPVTTISSGYIRFSHTSGHALSILGRWGVNNGYSFSFTIGRASITISFNNSSSSSSGITTSTITVDGHTATFTTNPTIQSSSANCVYLILVPYSNGYFISLGGWFLDGNATIAPTATQLGLLYGTTSTPNSTNGSIKSASGDIQYVVDYISNYEKPDISDFLAILNKYNWRYTGDYITPTLTITDTDTGTVLVEGTDYTKTYTNNLNAGTANVLAAGIGDYTGSKSIDFYIIATDLTISVNCSLNKYTWEYTGDFITPEVQVWDALEEVQLTNGVDYQYTYTNNLNVGTADVTIVGIGDWTGTVHLTFTIVENEDPYNQGGTTDPSSGHDGDYDNSSDPVDFPTLPDISAISSRLVTVYVPTLAELQSLAGVLWGGLLDPASFIKLFADPWDYLLGLSMIPVTPSYASGTVFMANVNMGITMRYATTQYVNINCGIVHLSEYWGNYLDYSPYTKVEIYLPYIGMRSLDIDDIMGRDIQLRYTIDVLTGTCVAMIKCIASDHITDFDDNLNSVVYTFTGNCATQIPLTANNWNETYRAIIQMTVSAANTIATGAMRASVAKSPDNTFMERSAVAAASNLVTSAASSIGSTNKPIVQKSNTTGSTAGFLSIQKPYLVITRPIQALPALQNTYTGYPQYATLQLSDLTGYTEVESIHLLGIPGTLEEINEIYSLLHSGVIL